MKRPTALIKEETDMRVFLRRLTAAVLLILCLASAALAEDAFDVTLARGERWTIPEDRLGGCAISDETVVSLDAGQLVGLRPGRAEVRLSGEQPTLLRVLVLYAEAEPAVETDGESAPPAAQTDYRYYAVSDTDDEDEPAEQAQDIEPASTDSAEPADVPEDEEAEAADELQTEPEALPEEPAADAGADAAAASDDLTVQAYDRSAVPDAINTVIDFALNEWRERANARLAAGQRRLEEGMMGRAALYEPIDNGRFHEDKRGYDSHEVEKAMLLDPDARLGASGYFEA